MADIILIQPTPTTEEEYHAAFSIYVTETQRLLDQMQSENSDAERFRDRSRLIHAEILALKAQTQEILAKLEATI